MRSKSLILLVLALGCGLVASIGITRALDQPVPQVVAGETKEILVASVEIKTGDPITPQIVKLANWPVETLPEGVISDLKEVDGRRAKTKIYPGEPLIALKLLGKDEKDDVLGDLPPGMRAVAVKVDAVSGGAGLLKPGDKVDVFVHVNANPGAGIPVAKTISPKDLRNIKVFAIDSITTRGNDGEQTVVAKTISLVVTPAQAKLVTLSQNLGEIRLVGRNAKDNDTKEDDETQVDYTTLIEGIGSSSRPAPDITQQIEQSVPKLEPTPSTAPVAVTPDPNVKREVMIIREGAGAREVIFENGKPIVVENPPAQQPVVEKSAEPAPPADDEPAPSDVPPPARPNPLRLK